MKTKFFKFVIPAFAILLAVAVSAFTSLESLGEVKEIPITGYIVTTNPQRPCDDVKVDDCGIGGTFDCTYEIGSSQPVFDSTLCVQQLSKLNH